MKRSSIYKLFLAYLALVLSFFVYTSATGTRILGDDKEEFEPNGASTGGSTGYRGSRYYHK
ncbi:hypothetical protein CLV24_12368 [Pontibacter ummariensis]|uniref:Uncharacterized protein n=1 Tax=Pontibacter ummariensis TaxID=1610492 RepID=A0A239JT91_9BACT|nr:hypothetical protein [Pontibacter ummariensis]PRY07419.1 hypothetical protein CLV24_12368 [Pontibacter ummariensis]SNT08985.1 hypothetical protein SAMN06296052_12368 [Pontibacter ummariensis]